MFSEARKLHLIEKVISTTNERTLVAMEKLIGRYNDKIENSINPIMDFAGIWSNEEAGEVLKAIEESCENIHPDDWK